MFQTTNQFILGFVRHHSMSPQTTISMCSAAPPRLDLAPMKVQPLPVAQDLPLRITQFSHFAAANLINLPSPSEPPDFPRQPARMFQLP